MAPKKKGGNAAANMTPEQIAAKRAAAMAMFGGGASSAAAPKPKPAAAAATAAAADKEKAATSAGAPAAAVDVTDAAAKDLDIMAIADDVGSKGLGESNESDWLSGQHNTPGDSGGEYATSLPETWQRLVTLEPMPTMLKAAKKSGTSSAAPNDCKLVEFKNVAYLFDADGKHVTSFRTQLEGANLGTSDKPLVRGTKDKHKLVLGKAPNYMKDAIAAHCDVTVTLLPTHHVMVAGADEATKEAVALIDNLVDGDGEEARKTLAERLAVAEPFCGFLEVQCPDDWVGGIIGKGGKGLKMIADESGTTIDYEEPEVDEATGKPVEGGKPGFFRVKAKFENNCRLAEKRIQERLALIQKLDVHTYVMVPRQSVGRLIGKGGSNIKILQHQSGANRITFDKDTGGKSNSQQCIILAADVEGSLEAGLVVLQAVPAESIEAKDVLKARLASFSMQLAALGKEADVDATEEDVKAAYVAKYGVVDKDEATGKPNYDKVAAESSKTKPIELAALSFELWQYQWAVVDATVAGAKPKM